MTGTSPDADRQAVLDAERAVNERYRKEIEQLLEKQPDLIKQVATAQSQVWTDSSLPRSRIADHVANTAIIGRVALGDEHPKSDILGQDFYIAGWHIELDGLEAVNWAAPVASLFFEGRQSSDQAAQFLAGRRTFVLRTNDLVDYSDEFETGVSEPFEKRALDLEIPAAPVSRRSQADPAGQQRKPLAPKSEHPVEPQAVEPQTIEPQIVEPGDHPEDALNDRPRSRMAGIRAAEAVDKVMQQPKQGRMGAVLPTMQPDQYQFVTAPADRGLIVQGQPGTGKTVIAAHRAAYLTSKWQSSKRIARVAIVGPSDGYVDYVKPILAELREPDAEVRVISLPDLLRSISGLRSYQKPGPNGRIESSWELGREIDRFVRAMAEPPRSGRIDQRVRHVVEAMRVADKSQVSNEEIRDWLQNLPKWNEVSAQDRYLPMLATISLALRPLPASERVGHLVVDEAQDIRQLEWRILTTSLLEPDGKLSLFGDMNQRRSDWTISSWLDLAVNLEMTDEGGQFPIHELETGFRSTRQILKFANQLLPRGKRNEHALQDGPQPRVVKVSKGGRTSATVEEAMSLMTRHSGRVSIISTQPRLISDEFRKRGWNRGQVQHSWRHNQEEGNGRLVVLHPDEARGLEFDAAVVVEPGAFPENVGRHGVLYTSLTRANKELTVVHSQRLPRHLRPPR